MPEESRVPRAAGGHDHLGMVGQVAHGLDLDAAGARPGPHKGRGATQAHPSHRNLGTEPIPGHPPSQPADTAPLSQRPLTYAPRPEPAPRAQADGYADHRPRRDLAASADRHQMD